MDSYTKTEIFAISMIVVNIALMVLVVIKYS
jgi:hypothetical protein